MQNDNSITPISKKVDIQTTPVNPQDSSSNDWALYENTLYIHKKLMELGIVAVVSAAENESLTLIDEHHIVIDDQRDNSADPRIDPKKKQQVLSYSSTSATTELSQRIGMTPGVQSGLRNNEQRSLKQSTDLLNKLKQFANSKPIIILRTYEGNRQFQIVNTLCSNEVFLPVCINQTGFYLHSWLSKNNPDWNFTGFEQFVTTAYLFGSDSNHHRRKLQLLFSFSINNRIHLLLLN